MQNTDVYGAVKSVDFAGTDHEFQFGVHVNTSFLHYVFSTFFTLIRINLYLFVSFVELYLSLLFLTL